MSATGELAYRFDDGEGYERYMGRWSRAVCSQFLAWLRAPRRAAWLELGCGTGVLSQAILASEDPASVEAIDPAPAQVALARRKVADPRILFEVADACALPYGNGTFDVVASALVVNFVPDRAKAMAESHRVLRAGGCVGGFVWDFEDDASPSGPVRRALAAVGTPAPAVPGTAASTLGSLYEALRAAGFSSIEVRAFETTQRFASADEFWAAQATGSNPVVGYVERLSPGSLATAKANVASQLQPTDDGRVTCTARANAFRARKP